MFDYSQDGQHVDIDDCLVKLAEVLRTLGIEELSITRDGQYHLVNSDPYVNNHLLNSFCTHIRQLHTKIVNITDK